MKNVILSISLPNAASVHELVKLRDFVYTPEIHKDGNFQCDILPEMFKDMQLT